MPRPIAVSAAVCLVAAVAALFLRSVPPPGSVAVDSHGVVDVTREHRAEPFARARSIPWPTAPVRRVRVGAAVHLQQLLLGPSSSLAAAAVARVRPNEPFIMEGSQVQAWSALDAWRAPARVAEALRASSVDSRGRVKVHNSAAPAIRLHSAVNPLGQLPGVEWRRPYSEVLVSPERLLRPYQEPHQQQLADEADTVAASVDNGGDGSSAAASPSWLYFFSPLANQSKVHGLSEEVGPLGFLAVHPDTGSFSSSSSSAAATARRAPPPPMETNVWIGQPNVTTPAHYDAVHNAYVQVNGTKHFVLIPPRHWRCLHLFPRLHPGARMSQVPWDRVGSSGGDPAAGGSGSTGTAGDGGAPSSPPSPWLQFPRLAAGGACDGLLRPGPAAAADEEAEDASGGSGNGNGNGVVEATLRPGDVLYIPPFWFHRVEVVGPDPSLSVSVHSESAAAVALLGIANSRAVPRLPGATYSDVVLCVSAYVRALVEQVLGADDARPFLRDMVATLYDPLRFDTDATAGLWDALAAAEAAFVQHTKEIRSSAAGDGNGNAGGSSADEGAKETGAATRGESAGGNDAGADAAAAADGPNGWSLATTRRFVRQAAVVVAEEMLETAEEGGLDRAVVEIVASQHVEDVVAHSLGPTHVPALLRYAAGDLQLQAVPRARERAPADTTVFVAGDGATFARRGDLVVFRLSVAPTREQVWDVSSREQHRLRLGSPNSSPDEAFPALEAALAAHSLGTQLVVDVPFEHGFGARGSAPHGIAPFQDFAAKVKIVSVLPGGAEAEGGEEARR